MILAQTKIFNVFPESVKLLQYLKFHPLFAADTSITIYLAETFGLIAYILTYLVLVKNNV